MGRNTRIGLCVGLLCVLGLAACGSDDDEGASSNNPAALASCNKLCDGQETGQCSLIDLQTCKQLCDAIVQSASAPCVEKNKAAWDCQTAQADMCDSSACQTQMQAASGCQ